MKIASSFEIWRLALVYLMLIAPMLVACVKTDVPIPIHGVNYRAEAFSYVLVDPTNPKNAGGGELIEPFSAGGTMCCYTLPAKWRPGMKVEVRATHWLPILSDGTLPKISKKHLVEVPKYSAGDAGELWVIRAPDESINLIASNFQPDHNKWPGKIKGWPVPTAAHQRKFEDMHIKDARDGVELYRSLLKELKDAPKIRAREAWAHSLKYDRKVIEPYVGSEDPAYLTMLKKYYESALIDARVKLEREEARP